MNIRRAILVSHLAVLPLLASAADWRSIPGSSTKMDVQTLELNANGSRRVWQKYTLDQPIIEKLSADLQRIGQPVNFDDYAHSVALWEYDCKGRRLSNLEGTNHASDGRVINSWEPKTPPVQRVRPDSDGEVTFNFICNFRPSRQGKR
jgi:hypothetical protein